MLCVYQYFNHWNILIYIYSLNVHHPPTGVQLVSSLDEKAAGFSIDMYSFVSTFMFVGNVGKQSKVQ